jgi:basic amino acid/polyamine antiporter, APA family
VRPFGVVRRRDALPGCASRAAAESARIAMRVAASRSESIGDRASRRPSLVRAIGRWSFAAAVVNSVIGSGIFVLPSSLAGLVGAWSPLAVILTGACVFTVVLCFAEVGSRYDQTGGPYLYVGQAFGRAIGFLIGWLHLWTRLFSGGAVLNVIATYLAVLLPSLGSTVGRASVMTIAVALVTGINVVGVRQSAWAVNVFTVAKVLPLLLLVALGSSQLRGETLATQTVMTASWLDAALLLVFAYGGFESSVIAAGEMRDPKRDTTFGLLLGMVGATLIYAAVQLVVVGVLPHAANTDAPIARTLDVLLGRGGMALAAIGLIWSGYGWFTGFALMTPRIVFAMAERGELPRLFSHVHPRFRTPDVAILVNSAIALAFGLAGGFTGLAALAAIPRLVMYASVCAALVVLRRSEGPAPFHLPGGSVIAAIGAGFSVWMLTTRSFGQAWPLILLVAAGLMLWAMRARQAAPGD